MLTFHSLFLSLAFWHQSVSGKHPTSLHSFMEKLQNSTRNDVGIGNAGSGGNQEIALHFPAISDAAHTVFFLYISSFFPPLLLILCSHLVKIVWNKSQNIIFLSVGLLLLLLILIMHHWRILSVACARETVFSAKKNSVVVERKKCKWWRAHEYEWRIIIINGKKYGINFAFKSRQSTMVLGTEDERNVLACVPWKLLFRRSQRMYEPRKKNVNELTRQFEVKRAILWEIEYVNVHQRDWALNFSNGIQSHVWYDWLLQLFTIFYGGIFDE